MVSGSNEHYLKLTGTYPTGIYIRCECGAQFTGPASTANQLFFDHIDGELMGEPKTDYLMIHRGPTPVSRTITVNPDLLVDLNADGTIFGIESLAGSIKLGTLLEVLKVVKWSLDGSEDSDR